MANSDNQYVVQGGKLLEDNQEAFQAGGRRCKDVCWTLLFLAATVCLIVLAVIGFSTILAGEGSTTAADKAFADALLKTGLSGLLIGCALALVTGLVFLQMCQIMPVCLVWTALCLSPMMLMAAGIGALVLGNVILGTILLPSGFAILACVCCCFRRLVPLTVMMIEAIASVIKKHMCMVGIALIGGLVSMAWIVLCSLALFGAVLMSVDAANRVPDAAQTTTAVQGNMGKAYGVYFVVMFCIFWGGFVVKYAVHTANCGVFGRWYVGKDDRSPVSESMTVAFGYSFGSICLGGLIIALVRAAEAVAKAMKDTSDNIVAAILACIVQCCLRCIGDMIEWISGFAYVQIAMRGFSFCEGVSATFAMCTVSNIAVLVACSMVGSVASLAAVVCAVVGFAGAFFYSWPWGLIPGQTADGNMMTEAMQVAYCTSLLGLLAGATIGLSMTQCIESGGQTLMVCFAEMPEVLQRTHPSLHKEWVKRLEDAGFSVGGAREIVANGQAAELGQRH